MNFEGKTIAFLGDSITEGVGVEECLEFRYDNVVKRRCKLKKALNYGISGTRLAHQQKPSEKPRYDLCFCGRAYDIDKNADAIVVYGGVNDYIHGDAYFGEMTDDTPETFCGAVEFIMNLLSELYPNAQKVFITPARCVHGTNHYERPSDRECKKSDAKPLKAYVDVIAEKGKKHNIPVLNLYEELPIDPGIEEDRETYTVDGLHFNKYGQEALGNLLTEFLQNLN